MRASAAVLAEPEPQEDEQHEANERLQQIAGYDGNLVDVLDEKQLATLGVETIEEFEIDKASRKDWEESAERSLKLAKQKRDAKMTPWPNASNINYPAMMVAAMQFNARALPAIVRNNEVLMAKIVGDDPLEFKAQRARRMSDFSNNQLLNECEEWEPGTDTLLMALPIVGAGFRKVSWDSVLGRPRLDYASALKVYAANDAPSFDQAPRVTQTFDRYPYQIRQMIKAGTWEEFDYLRDSSDTQKPCDFLEQHRYMDLDEDGLDEPYIVTVHKESSKVVRIDAAFDPRDIRVGEVGDVEAITRFLPWVDYGFLPDPEGGVYAMGFGSLLESLQAAIDTSLNQMMDAGHLANAPGGFIGQGLNIRGGTYRVEPNTFKIINASADDIRKAIYTHQFPGPSPVLFQLVDLLLAAAKDITAVKDVLTGEAPSQQPATSTLALIEQGLSVFTAIYKRIYRSLRKEYQLLWRLNARYLSPEKYKAVLDRPLKAWQPPEGAPPPPPEAQAAIDREMQRGVSPADFEASDYDVRPVSDPKAATMMQQLAQAEFLRSFKGDATVNQAEVNKRIFAAARIEDPDKLTNVPPNPAIDLDMQQKAADLDKTKAETDKIKAETAAKDVDTKDKAFDAGAKQGFLGSMAGEPGDGVGAPVDDEAGGGPAGSMDVGELVDGGGLAEAPVGAALNGGGAPAGGQPQL